MTILILLILAASAAAGLSALKPNRLTALLATALSLFSLCWIGIDKHQKEEEQKRLAIIAMRQEVSPGQYLTMAAIAQKSPKAKAAIREALADRHIIWSEYSPIEQQAAQDISDSRIDALRAVGLNPTDTGNTGN